MLRLKPSEITLIPADVEETRRRMERAQAANRQTLPGNSRPSVPGAHGTRRLRRGPQRSRDDALTNLGDIPILTPQQAVFASINEQSPRDSLVHSSSEDESSDLPLSSHPDDLMPGSSSAMAALAGHDIQLPFRPAPRDHQSDHLASQRDSNDGEKSHTRQTLSPPRVGRTRTNSSAGHDETPSSLMQTAIDGLADSAFALNTPRRYSGRPRRPSILASSPFRPARGIRSPRQQDGDLEQSVSGAVLGSESAATRAAASSRFIQGYWDSHDRYRFMEVAPQTEPRPRTQQSQHVRRVRAMSSSSEPPHYFQTLRPNPSSSAEDVFWTSPVPELDFTQNVYVRAPTEPSNDPYLSSLETDPTGHTILQRATSGDNSEASSSSQPYSLYELPDSRHSSGNHSDRDPLAQSQFDGPAASRQTSRGAYYSIRLSQNRLVHASARQLHRPVSVSSAEVSHHGPSPLPVRPYARVPSTQQALTSSLSLLNVSDLLGGDQSAASAIERRLVSPLDLIEERGTTLLHSLDDRDRARAARHGVLAANPGPHSVATRSDPNRQRRPSGSESWRDDIIGGVHNHMGARPRAHHPPPPPLPSSAYTQGELLSIHTRVAESLRQSNHARAAQRSSENEPVGQDSQDSTHRALPGPSQRPNESRQSHLDSMRGGEFPTSPAARFSMPHVARPRDVSNRPQMQTHQAVFSSDYDPSGSDTLTPVQGTTHLAPPSLHPGPRIPPRRTSRQDMPSNPVQHRSTRRMITPVTAPLPFSRQSERGLPSTSMTLDSVSGVISRRAQMVTASVSGRRQAREDQENSEEVQREDMSRESAAVSYRRGEGRADVMEETPPRMGRYERAAFG